MKKIIIIVIVLCICNSIFSQSDPELKRRFHELKLATEAMNLNTILDYTYPKVFTIVPRTTMLEALKTTVSTTEFSIKFDSLKIDSLYPIFKLPAGSFAKINSSMIMIMNVKYPADLKNSDEKKEYYTTMVTAMESQFGKQKVTTDSIGNIYLNVNSLMIAVKDPKYSNSWYFVNLEKNESLTAMLFSKEIVDKLETYK